jgi:hypothetical protein
MKIEKILESRFGELYVSSIMIPLVIFLFTAASGWITDYRSRRDLRKDMDIEIEGRLSQFLVMAEHEIHKHRHPGKNVPMHDSVQSFKSDSSRARIRMAWEALKSEPAATTEPCRFSAIHAEYENTSVVSLIVKLSTLVDEREKDNLKKAANFLIADGLFPAHVDNPFANGKELWSRIEKKLVLERWRMNFPYTDWEIKPVF